LVEELNLEIVVDVLAWVVRTKEDEEKVEGESVGVTKV
jgi:hypothetical protein